MKVILTIKEWFVLMHSLVQMKTVVAGDAVAADGGGQTWLRHMPPPTPSF